MRTVNILSLQRSTAADLAKIRAVDPGIVLTDAGGWFDGEIRDTWSDYAIKRYLTPGSTGEGTRELCEAVMTFLEAHGRSASERASSPADAGDGPRGAA